MSDKKFSTKGKSFSSNKFIIVIILLIIIYLFFGESQQKKLIEKYQNNPENYQPKWLSEDSFIAKQVLNILSPQLEKEIAKRGFTLDEFNYLIDYASKQQKEEFGIIKKKSCGKAVEILLSDLEGSSRDNSNIEASNDVDNNNNITDNSSVNDDNINNDSNIDNNNSSLLNKDTQYLNSLNQAGIELNQNFSFIFGDQNNHQLIKKIESQIIGMDVGDSRDISLVDNDNSYKYELKLIDSDFAISEEKYPIIVKQDYTIGSNKFLKCNDKAKLRYYFYIFGKDEIYSESYKEFAEDIIFNLGQNETIEVFELMSESMRLGEVRKFAVPFAFIENQELFDKSKLPSVLNTYLTGLNLDKTESQAENQISNEDDPNTDQDKFIIFEIKLLEINGDKI